jgi:hypothetical protein
LQRPEQEKMAITEMLTFGMDEDDETYKPPDLSKIDLNKVYNQAKGLF